MVLRDKYNLIVDCTDVVPATANSPVTVNLLIPEGINKNMFPLDFTLEPQSKTIYPNSSLNQIPVKVDKSIVPGHESENSFQYIKTLNYNYLLNSSNQICIITPTNHRFICINRFRRYIYCNQFLTVIKYILLNYRRSR